MCSLLVTVKGVLADPSMHPGSRTIMKQNTFVYTLCQLVCMWNGPSTEDEALKHDLPAGANTAGGPELFP